jgi:hypothetical protein
MIVSIIVSFIISYYVMMNYIFLLKWIIKKFNVFKIKHNTMYIIYFRIRITPQVKITSSFPRS